MATALEFDDDRPPPGAHAADELHGIGTCPYCGDTLPEAGNHGTAPCEHHGIDIWVPARFR